MLHRLVEREDNDVPTVCVPPTSLGGVLMQKDWLFEDQLPDVATVGF